MPEFFSRFDHQSVLITLNGIVFGAKFNEKVTIQPTVNQRNCVAFRESNKNVLKSRANVSDYINIESTFGSESNYEHAFNSSLLFEPIYSGIEEFFFNKTVALNPNQITYKPVSKYRYRNIMFVPCSSFRLIVGVFRCVNRLRLY